MRSASVRIGTCILLCRGLLSLGALLLLPWQSIYAQSFPQGFVDLAEAVPGIHVEPRYFDSDNFVGRPIP